ncbi:MAG: YraN family protein [Ruminococcus sp.]|nr:YraN family protein [Ruminococcus sp.]MDE7226001.1 YraN family protein [Ruminococcus sp.]
MPDITGKGYIGEEAVCGYLMENGYEIVCRNYRIRGGEIDIIAVNNDYIAFVEVKSRKYNSMVSGFDSVNKRKKNLIIKTACDFCCKYPNMLQPRFDVAHVTLENGRAVCIDYIQNAYDVADCNYIF